MLNRWREILILWSNAPQISCLETDIQSFLFYAYKHKTLTEVPFGGGTLSSITLSSFFSSDMFSCPGPETNMVIKSDFMQ